MTEPLRLFFDECLSKRLAARLSEHRFADYPAVETRHLFQDFPSGEPDHRWIPALAKTDSGRWVVVTKDRGKVRRSPQLPRICKEYRIAHLYLPAPFLQSPSTFILKP